MNKRDAERRKIVLIGGSIAAGTPAMAIYGQQHPALMWAWFGGILVALLYVVMQLVRIKKSRRQVR